MFVGRSDGARPTRMVTPRVESHELSQLFFRNDVVTRYLFANDEPALPQRPRQSPNEADAFEHRLEIGISVFIEEPEVDRRRIERVVRTQDDGSRTVPGVRFEHDPGESAE